MPTVVRPKVTGARPAAQIKTASAAEFGVSIRVESEAVSNRRTRSLPLRPQVSITPPSDFGVREVLEIFRKNSMRERERAEFR